MKRIDWDRTLTLLSPHSYALLSTIDETGRANLMGLGWWMITSWEPQQIAISVGKGQFSRMNLDFVNEFVLCFPTAAQAKGAWICGTVSGRDGDKFRMAGFDPEPSEHVRPPRIADCLVAIECRVLQRHETGDHVLYVGDVQSIHGAEFEAPHLYSIHYNKLIALDHHLTVMEAPGRR